ncbi:MAG: dipeptide epimerase [candidate division NC10 bacterium]|nr:dipeptide epimerase [candidate division NC10 bacterium]
MKIERIEIIPFEVPYRRGDVTTSLGRHGALRNVLLGLYADTGDVGWGEAAPLPTHSGETQESIVALLEHSFGPLLLGQDPREIPLRLRDMDRLLWGQAFSKCAVDFALHDLVARHLGMPLYLLLGGKCRDTYPLGWTIGWKSVDATVAEAVEAVQREGFKAVKLKIGNPDWRPDLERVRAVRKALGDDVPIRVDANQGYAPHAAVQVIRRMEDCALQLVEQPVPRWDVEGLAYVRRLIPFPVMADEAAFTVHDVLRLARECAADIINIKPQKFGGLARSREVAALASAADIEVFASARMCSGIGVAAATHFYASLPAAGFEGEFVDGILMGEDDLLVEPIEVKDGFVRVPGGPGLGVSLHRGKLERYASRPIVLTA